MYGLIGKILAAPGRRDDLLAIMLDGAVPMEGCRSYIIARDPASEDGIWITEVWDSKELHAASLQIPAVRETISKAKPIIAGFGERFETEPMGGQGL
ncbi:MAG: antibiotic biosynthesis monooxygenase [Devosia sp.]|uniref:putative quinol monooxygenase n=1 Tax=Devosia sp. TaxID=1871048 RepID=UPI0024CDCA9D|nr:putative quinol monooxygenase [Devosia sp.]UYO00758.1 MAG: antibiotic biosynthesis monooxygenase [Devosia sp.]